MTLRGHSESPRWLPFRVFVDLTLHEGDQRDAAAWARRFRVLFEVAIATTVLAVFFLAVVAAKAAF